MEVGVFTKIDDSKNPSLILAFETLLNTMLSIDTRSVIIKAQTPIREILTQIMLNPKDMRNSEKK